MSTSTSSSTSSPASITVAVITYYDDGRIVTKPYNQDKIPQVIMDRIAGLPNEQDWNQVCFGDLKSVPSNLLQLRRDLLKAAELDEDYTTQYHHKDRLVGMVRQYLAPLLQYHPRVYKFISDYHFGTPVDIYYRESELPLCLVERIRHAKDDPNMDMHTLLYEDVSDSHSGMVMRCKQLAAAQLGHAIHVKGYHVVKTLQLGDGTEPEEC